MKRKAQDQGEIFMLLISKTSMNLYSIVAFQILFLMAIGYSVPSLGQSYQIQQFQERLSEQVDVSGGILMGYQLEGKAVAPELSELYVARPNEIDSLRLQIRTIDGIYSADMEISFISDGGLWQKLSIPSEHKESLKKYSKKELVAYAYNEIEDQRNQKIRYHHVFPTSWGEPEVDNMQGSFYVNSAASVARYTTKSGSVFCMAIEATVKTAFNKMCDIVNGLSSGDNVVVMNTGRNKKYLIWLP